MKNNNLSKVEQSLRSIAKRYKNIKYSTGLAILFLMLGVNAFSEEVSSTEFVEQSKNIRSGMKNSIGDIRSKIESVKAENNKEIGNLRLELVKLMEQGDQVVKSPWSSWQFGANYFYSNWRGTYEGKGDKKEKYPYEGRFARSNNLFLRVIHPDSRHYNNFTTSEESTRVGFSAGTSDSLRAVLSKASNENNKTLATTSLRGGDEDSYGLGNSRIRQEDIVDIELRVSVGLRELDNFSVRTPDVKAPIQTIALIKDVVAPNVAIPTEKTVLATPERPTTVRRPTITVPEAPENPTHVTPTLTVGKFTPLVPSLYNRSANPGYDPTNIRVLSYHSNIDEGTSYWNEITNQYEAGPNGAKNNGKFYDHNQDATINNGDLSGNPALMYTSNKYYSIKNTIDPSGDSHYEIEKNADPKYEQALFKIWFEYGSRSQGYTVADNDAGGKTLTVGEGTNLTIDSINNITNSDSNINKQRFLVGGSRAGSLDNAVNATIENKGTVNLLGPLTLGFESQTDTAGISEVSIKEITRIVPTRPGFKYDETSKSYINAYLIGKRQIINSEKGMITDAIEASDKTPDLGGLKVSKVDQNGNIVESAADSATLQLGKVGYEYGGDENNGEITIKRTPDIVDKNNPSSILKHGGYTGYKVGMILTTEDSDEGDTGSTTSNDAVQSLINKGTIRFNGGNSIGIQVYAPNYRDFKANGNSKIEVANEEGGKIELNGDKSTGMRLSSQVKDIIRFENKGTINLGGSYSSGIAVIKDPKIEGTIKAPSTLEDEYIGKIQNKGTININAGRESSAMFLKGGANNILTNSGIINIKGNENIGLKVVQDGQITEHHNGGDGNLIDRPPTITNIKKVNIQEGTGHIGMLAFGVSEAINLGEGEITLQGKKNVGMLASSMLGFEGYEALIVSGDAGPGNIINHGKINTVDNKNNEGIIAMVLDKDTKGEHTGKINLTGKAVVGVYNSGMADGKDTNSKFKMIDEYETKIEDHGYWSDNGDSKHWIPDFRNVLVPLNKIPEINVSGEKSIAVYARGRRSTTYLEQGKISATGGIGLYADRAAIEIGKRDENTVDYQKNTVALTAGDKAVLFYNYSHTNDTEHNFAITPVAKGNFVLNNSVNAEIKNGGAAFYLRGSDINNKVTFLNKMFTDTADAEDRVSANGKKLNLKMADASTLFITENDNIANITNPQKLSALSSINLGNRVAIADSSSTKYKIEKSLRNKMEVDTDVNLDDATNTYNRLEYHSSWVKVNSGKKMTSSTDNKVAIFQANIKREEGSTLSAPKASDIQVSNAGNISLAGKKSVALGTNFGQVTNSGNISVSGENSVGIYGADSSEIKNTEDGTIEVGVKGAGIYAENDLKVNNESTAISANKNINITNAGTIKAKANSTNIYGIYAKNDKANYTNATASVTHSGNINLANTKFSTGIYLENGALTSSGNILVGKNSIAINAKKSTVALTKGNLTATSAVGIAVEDSTLNSSANINANENSIGLNIKNSKVTVNSGIYTVNKSIGFNITSLGANDYFKGNGGTLKLGAGSVGYYLKDVNLTSNSNFIDKLVLSSTGKYVYIYADNSTLNYENQKTITNDGSVFAYAKNSNITLKENTDINSNNKNVTAIFSENTTNNKNIINNGKIKLLGEASIGIYADKLNNLENNASLTMGSKTTGIYAKDTNLLKNTAKLSMGANSIGIFAVNTKVTNTNDIEAGVNAANNVGIFNEGNKDINNSGNIKVAGSKSIGIFSTNSTNITNSGNITVGDSVDSKDISVGIFAENSNITSSGNVTAGNKSIGIYGKNINIGNSSKVTVGNEGTAIYAKNANVTVGNNTQIVTGNKSMAILANKITAGNNTQINLGTDSTAIYSKNSNAILGNNTQIVAGKNSTAIYGLGVNLGSNSQINLGANSTAVYSNNTSATLGDNIQVSAGNKSVGVYGKGLTLGKNFKITLGNEGTAIYSKDALATLGEGSQITTGAKSTGVYGDGLTIAKNSKVTVADESNAVYSKGAIATLGDNVQVSAGNKSAGVYGKGVVLGKDSKVSIGNEGTAIYSNDSSATLGANIQVTTGDKSSGIYGKGITSTTNLKVTVGNTSTAVYSKGAIATLGANTQITAGINSTGIYGNGVNLGSNSKVIVGNNSNAVYSNNAVANLGSGLQITAGIKSVGVYGNGVNLGSNSKVTLGNESTAIYSKDFNTTLGANTQITVGDKSTGVYAKDVNLGANSKVTLGNESTAIYSKDSNTTLGNNTQITVGDKSTGVYAKGVTVESASKLNTGVNSTVIYSTGGTVELKNNTELTAGANSTLVHYNGNNGDIINNSKMTINDNSFAFTIRGQNNRLQNNSTGTVDLKNNSVFIYSTDTQGSIVNKSNIVSSGNENYGIYSSGKVDNYGNIDFSNATGSIGLYSYYPTSARSGMASSTIPTVTNHSGSTITVSKSGSTGSGVGMAAGNNVGAIGHIVNRGKISVATEGGIGMYATGRGSIAENRGTIELSGNQRNIGMYLENGAIGENYGTITTVGSNNKEQIGIVVTSGARINNYGTIRLNAENGTGIYAFGGGIINNHGSFDIASGTSSTEVRNADQADTSKKLGGVEIKVRQDDRSEADIIVNGQRKEPTLVHSIPNRAPSEIPTSSVGIYMSSSGINRTNPVGGIGALAKNGIRSADLIIGAEATETENSKYIKLGQDIIDPYNQMLKDAAGRINKWEIYSSSLTWQATVTQSKTDQAIKNAYMAKTPYTFYTDDKNTTRDTYNFTDGLEQRYGVEKVGTREKEVFNQLNSIGNNEGILLKQAFDEMMGHQYANIHQRVRSTGDILDKEFTHLRRDWATASKKSNKVKTFGARGEYKTDTAGIIDYTNNAYGVAYVHENEDIRLGKGTGWYTGIVHNTFKFKDIGRSKEEMLQVKAGVFKSIPFDENNSLNWTISGDISYGYNKMNRKFLVVQEIFNAKGRYDTYGVALKNEFGKDFRISESISIRPYAAIKVEYAKIGKVKEKSGEIKLDVKDSHYTSVRPEVGVEANYKYILTSGKIVTARLGTAYEDELGKVAKANNKARVANTTADWFNLPKEKEDRKGNVKTDFSLGVEGEILGGTANIGYDTKGNNIRGGLGIRVIF